MKKIILTPLLLMGIVSAAFAGGSRDDVENIDRYRVGINIQTKLADDLRLSIAPEMRFYDGFDVFLVDGGLSYEIFDGITLGAAYRIVFDREEVGTVQSGFTTRTEYDCDYLHRYAFSISYKEDFGDFTPSVRMQYNNFTGKENTEKGDLRSRIVLKYDIDDCRLTPEVSIETFQSPQHDFKVNKIRYLAGFNYKVNKRSSFGFDYKLDFFRLEYKNAHIFTMGYKLSL